MSLDATIRNGVATAFSTLKNGNLTTQLQLTVTGVQGYDFSTGVVSSTPSTVTIDGILLDEDASGDDVLDASKRKFVINVADLPSDIPFNRYESFVTTAGQEYKIVSFVNNGYTVEGYCT